MREEGQGKYDDILHLPHPISRSHPQMPLQDRAAQFMPFAALTGHEDAVRETARLTDSRVELDEGQREKLDQRLSLLLKAIKEYPGLEPEITVTYFRPDEKKEGGAYLSVSGRVKRVDGYRRVILLKDGTSLPMDEIVSMAGDVFGDAMESFLLRDCTLPLENGKYYGVIGENGCGKSTLCKLLMNLYQPVSGKMAYQKNEQKKNKIVYIEDKPVILFDDIIRNIVVEGEADSARLESILQETELKSEIADNIEGKKADELSAGLLQRMAIARALYHVGEGDILVIDEGFSALDVENRNQMYRLVKTYQQKYHLLVMDITHNGFIN